jgi:DNA invertase Pin-like site-specific DNA recombinase
VALAGLKLTTPLAAYLREREESLKRGQVLAAWIGEPAGAQGRPDWRVRDRLSEQDATALVAQFVAGGSLKELARRYGINRVSIRRILREHGVLADREQAAEGRSST